MEQKKIYVVTDVDCEDTDEVELLAAFETREEAVAYSNQQERTYRLMIKETQLGLPFEEKPVIWIAHMSDKDGIMRISVDREDGDFYTDRLGMLCSYHDHHMSICFLAKNQAEAEEFSERMFKSILQRQQAGWFRYLHQAIYQPLDDDVSLLCRPFYNFRTGAIILPDQGRFVLSREAMEKEWFDNVKGIGPYTVPEKPLNYYDGFYSLLKGKEG